MKKIIANKSKDTTGTYSQDDAFRGMYAHRALKELHQYFKSNLSDIPQLKKLVSLLKKGILVLPEDLRIRFLHKELNFFRDLFRKICLEKDSCLLQDILEIGGKYIVNLPLKEGNKKIHPSTFFVCSGSSDCLELILDRKYNEQWFILEKEDYNALEKRRY